MSQSPVSDDIRALLETVEGSGDKDILPVSTAMATETRRKEEQKEDARQEKMAKELRGENEPEHLAGEMIRGQGIFVGRYAVLQTDGFRKTFNVFAAPQDLTETMKYPETVKAVSELKDYFGHDGAYYKDIDQLEEALLAGTYGDGWVIPSINMLCNVLKHKDEGVLKDSFRKAAAAAGDFFSYPEYYWSSTVRTVDGAVNTVNFLLGSSVYSDGDGHRSFSCRPVRLIEVKP